MLISQLPELTKAQGVKKKIIYNKKASLSTVQMLSGSTGEEMSNNTVGARYPESLWLAASSAGPYRSAVVEMKIP